MAQEIIGREQEIKDLQALYQAKKPVFAVVYGRRRVGKTFLVREMFDGKFAFYHTGLFPYELNGQKLKEKQLSNFYSSLVRYGSKLETLPADWLEAFNALIRRTGAECHHNGRSFPLVDLHTRLHKGHILPRNLAWECHERYSCKTIRPRNYCIVV